MIVDEWSSRSCTLIITHINTSYWSERFERLFYCLFPDFVINWTNIDFTHNRNCSLSLYLLSFISVLYSDFPTFSGHFKWQYYRWIILWKTVPCIFCFFSACFLIANFKLTSIAYRFALNNCLCSSEHMLIYVFQYFILTSVNFCYIPRQDIISCWPNTRSKDTVLLRSHPSWYILRIVIHHWVHHWIRYRTGVRSSILACEHTHISIWNKNHLEHSKCKLKNKHIEQSCKKDCEKCDCDNEIAISKTTQFDFLWPSQSLSKTNRFSRWSQFRRLRNRRF